MYHPKVCRFKTWLLRLARWRIQNQLRKRSLGDASAASGGLGNQPRSEETSGTDPIARIADPEGVEFGAEWDAAWEKSLLTQAMERVKERIDDRQFQVFDMHVTKGWSASEVARMFGISVARVYVTKHRVSALLKSEVRRLEKAAERALRKVELPLGKL